MSSNESDTYPASGTSSSSGFGQLGVPAVDTYGRPFWLSSFLPAAVAQPTVPFQQLMPVGTGFLGPVSYPANQYIQQQMTIILHRASLGEPAAIAAMATFYQVFTIKTATPVAFPTPDYPLVTPGMAPQLPGVFQPSAGPLPLLPAPSGGSRQPQQEQPPTNQINCLEIEKDPHENLPSSCSSSSATLTASSPELEPDPKTAPKRGRQVEQHPKTAKFCAVCEHPAKSKHYGGKHSCDSCKNFFRRVVVNSLVSHLRCSQGANSCPIDKQTRACCQLCRFQKCLEAGMRPKWVRTKADCMTINAKRDLLKRWKQEELVDEGPKQAFVFNGHEAKEEDLKKFLDASDISEIKFLARAYRQCFQQLPHANDGHPGDVLGELGQARMLSMVITLLERMQLYVQHLPGYGDLPFLDQKILEKHGLWGMCLLRAALAFDPEKRCWPSKELKMYENCPSLHVDNVRPALSNDTFVLLMRFIDILQGYQPDEAIVMLLAVITLFSPERMGLTRASAVAARQQKYTRLLSQYVNWRYSGDKRFLAYFLMILAYLPTLRNDRSSGHVLLGRLSEKEKKGLHEKLTKQGFKLCYHVTGLKNLNDGNIQLAMTHGVIDRGWTAHLMGDDDD